MGYQYCKFLNFKVMTVKSLVFRKCEKSFSKLVLYLGAWLLCTISECELLIFKTSENLVLLFDKLLEKKKKTIPLRTPGLIKCKDSYNCHPFNYKMSILTFIVIVELLP
jgi:hypothetical protein